MVRVQNVKRPHGMLTMTVPICTNDYSLEKACRIDFGEPSLHARVMWRLEIMVQNNWLLC